MPLPLQGPSQIPARVCEDPSLAPVAAALLWHASEVPDQPAYLAAALPLLSAAAGGDALLLATAPAGQWETLARTGTQLPLPVELLAEAMDRESGKAEGSWAVRPLAPSNATTALVLHCPVTANPRRALLLLDALAPVFQEGLAAVEGRVQGRLRVRRLEAILNIANQWYRTHELEPLLTQMAEAATQLFNADRASIFLWDRRRRVLVGRPALGIKGGELRIPDDRGVVGRVIQNGQPLRVDATTDATLIDRQVDTQTGYRTRSILCVPLRSRSGEMFGAFELINKHTGCFAAEDETGLIELAAHAAVALENVQDRQQLLSTSQQITEQAAEQVRMIGQSRSITALRSIIQRVAATDLAVLILGENGTGKEVVAQMIHYLSSRRQKPFVAVNCAAIPDTLAESELFGHEKGAFTDAQETRLGKFELAADGTLFLDEIGDLSLSGQAKLLRVLEEHVLIRVGGSTPIHTEARVVAATNQNLAEMVRQKRFREDLYFRLNVVTLEIPPLRDRIDDILPLAEHFLADFSKKARRPPPEISVAARKRLEAHPWPGNVRELRNLMERLAYLLSEDTIEAEDLAFILSPRSGAAMMPTPDLPLTDATNRFQEEYIKRAIDQSAGNMTQAAAILGLHRSNLYRKMRQLGMSFPE